MALVAHPVNVVGALVSVIDLFVIVVVATAVVGYHRGVRLHGFSEV